MTELDSAASAEQAVRDDDLPLPNLGLRLVQVFVSPGELFARLQHQPAWFGALALGGLLVGLAAYLIPVELTVGMMRQQFMERGQDIPSGFETVMLRFRPVLVILGSVFFAIIAVVTTGVVTIIFTFLLGGEGRFTQYLSIISHAYLISAVSNMALIPLRIAAENPQLLLSVGTLLPFAGDGYLGTFLGLLDLFGLWTWVIVGLGVATVTKEQSWGSAATIVMVIPVGIAAVFAIWA